MGIDLHIVITQLRPHSKYVNSRRKMFLIKRRKENINSREFRGHQPRTKNIYLPRSIVQQYFNIKNIWTSQKLKTNQITKRVKRRKKLKQTSLSCYSQQITSKLITSKPNIEKPRVHINHSHDPSWSHKELTDIHSNTLYSYTTATMHKVTSQKRNSIEVK